MKKKLLLITALVLLAVFLTNSMATNVSAKIYPITHQYFIIYLIQDSVTINGGEADTYFLDVVLSLTTGLQDMSNPIVSMQFTNTNPTILDAWMGMAWFPWSATHDWTLAGSAYTSGTRTVWARYQLQDGTIGNPFSDSIDYWAYHIVIPDSVTINSGAATTETLDVTLSLNAEIRKYSEEVVSMRFWNQSTLEWSSWEPWASTKDFHLFPSGQGTKTVTVMYQLRDGTTTNSFSDTIEVVAVEAVATPTFSPPAGTYSSSQSVTVSCATSGATIRFTLDGSEPTSSSASYSGPISVSSGTVTVRAKAFKSGMTDSDTASATYTIEPPVSKVATPTFSPSGGSYSSSQNVALSCSTSGATIRYTTDGSEPSSSSTAYSSSIQVSSTTTVKVKAFKSGMTTSDTASVTYIINPTGGLGFLEIALIGGVVGAVAVAGVVVYKIRKRPKKQPTPAPKMLRIQAEPRELLADGKSKSTITLQLLDEKGTPIAASEDIQISLTSTRGSVEKPTITIPKGKEEEKTFLVSSVINGPVTLSADAKGLKGITMSLNFLEKKRYCMHCGTIMPFTAKLCQKCGKAPPAGVDTKVCRNCSSVVPVVAKFCSECGAGQPE